MYAGVAIGVITAGWIGLRACNPPTNDPNPEIPATAQRAATAEAVDALAGVPHGGRNDAEHARNTAVAAVSLTGEIATAGFITRSDLIASIATTGFGPVLASLSSTQLAEMSAELGEAGVSPTELVWSEIPLTARIVSADDDRVVVDVWAVLVVGVPGVGAPRQAWRTVTVEVAWERAAWRIDGWATRAGPTPALAATSVVSSVADIAEVVSWPAAGGGG
jgi:hypothetical protein